MVKVDVDRIFDRNVVAALPSPWAMAFLPDGQMLVTERQAGGASNPNPTASGALRLVTTAGAVSGPIAGLPENVGVLDIALDPAFATNHLVYFSIIQRDPAAPRMGAAASVQGIDPAGIAVGRAVLDLDDPSGPTLKSAAVIWQQVPKIVSYPGSGEPGGRLAFSPDGAHLFITAGDRQEFAPVQSLETTLGKIIRINPDGSIPADNPFVDVAGARPEIWSLGHRNPYGLVFDAAGTLWSNEMGPSGGDELNRVDRAANYGWPNVSYGNNYDGSAIAKPSAGDGYTTSALTWTPVIAPSDMISYSGAAFEAFRGDLILSGLQSRGLVVVDTENGVATEALRIDFGARVRDITQAPDGSLWVLYDQPDGRLVHLTPLAGSVIRLGGMAPDSLAGGARADVLSGQAGDDVLSGGAGADFLIGDSGRDTFHGTVAELSGDTIADFGYGDRITVSDASLTNFNLSVSGSRLTFNGASLDLGAAPEGALRAVTSAAGGVDIIFALRLNGSDFGGDGAGDILWRNLDGAVTTWRSAGAGFIQNATALRTAGSPWHIQARADFNGDGRTDILWRDSGGTVTSWLSAGASFIDTAAAARTVDNGWRVAGAADFNRDGRADILWRNVDGTVTAWVSIGDGFADAPGFARPVANDWRVAGVGDFNGDGAGDILWRNFDGTVTAWLSNGARFADAAGFSRMLGTERSIVAVDDFDGDGRTDLLLRSTDGTVTSWLSSGTQFVENPALHITVGAAWQVADTGDYDADGRADLLWRHADGQVTVWRSTGSSFVGSTTFLLAVDPRWTAEGALRANGVLDAGGDFNGDGRDDLLWRHRDGTVTNWLSNGTGFSDNAALSRVVPAVWSIAGVGDFNGDGRDDLLWRHADGTVTDWLSTGTGLMDNAALSRVVAASWSIAATGDFNGDGRDDILWRHTDGTVTDWLSTGTGFADNAGLSRVVSATWSIVGTGDFNGDGKADILWRAADGTITTWRAAGDGFVDDPATARGASLDWTVAGIGDFNGDGMDDLLWRNVSGTVTDWLSDGSAFVDNAAGFSRLVPLDWEIAGVGDYNGDGREDILWRNAGGLTTDWLSTGASFADNTAFQRTVGNDWTLSHDVIFG